MASTLQIVDTSGSVLFDLNDPTGTNSGSYGAVYTELLHNPDWGAPTQDAERFSSPLFDGGSTSYRHTGLTPASIRIRVRHPSQSYDGLAQALGELSRLLAAGCVMKWIPNGSAKTLYADIEPTETPVILDGRELALYLATSLVDTPDGVTLSLLRQPYFRGAELDPTVQLLDNGTLTRDTAQDGVSDFWTSSAGTWSITADGLRVSYNGSGVISLGYQSYSAAAATQLTFQAEARVISGAGGARIALFSSPGLVSSATSSTITSTAWTRITVTHTIAGGDSAMRAYLQQGSGSGTSVYEFRKAQLETGASASTFRVGVETPSNDPTVAPGRYVMFWAEGDAPTPVRCYFAGSSHRRVTVGATSGGAALANYGFQQAESMTAITGDMSTATVGATASGSSADVARCSFSVSAVTSNRIYWTLSANELAAVVGKRLHVWIRARAVTSTEVMEFNVRWQYRSYSAVALNYDNGTRSSSTSTTGAWEDIDLGSMTVPADASALTVIIGIGRTTGSGSADVDFVQLVPADQMGYHGNDSGLTGSAWSLYETDPSIPRVAEVSSGHLVKEVGEAVGPVPFVAQPGLNAVYVARTGVSTFGHTQFESETFAAYDVSFYYSPRYHQ